MARSISRPVAQDASESTSQTVFREQAGHELVFAIVGHVGSGVTHTAKMLETALEDEEPSAQASR